MPNAIQLQTIVTRTISLLIMYLTDKTIEHSSGDQEAEFETTFFGGVTYRAAACSGFEQGNILFSVKDENNNVLLTI